MSKPLAVLISDVHYSLKTWQIADTAFRMAVDEAAALGVDLIDCGDLTNDKAQMRAEYVNAIIETMLYAKAKGVKVYCLVGNHSLCNEKGEAHSLHFLRPYCTVIDRPQTLDGYNFIPYQNTSDRFIEAIQQFPKGSMVIGHQGTIGGYLGDYVRDSSAIDPALVKDWTVYLGHFHRHYTLGTTISIGNPYTLTFGEAADGPKGFLIVYGDYKFRQIQTGLRKHVKIEVTAEELLGHPDGMCNPFEVPSMQDLLWLKVHGTQSELAMINKKQLAEDTFGHTHFKLEKVVTESAEVEESLSTLPAIDVLDKLINLTGEVDAQKKELSELARELLS